MSTTYAEIIERHHLVMNAQQVGSRTDGCGPGMPPGSFHFHITIYPGPSSHQKGATPTQKLRDSHNAQRAGKILSLHYSTGPAHSPDFDMRHPNTEDSYNGHGPGFAKVASWKKVRPPKLDLAEILDCVASDLAGSEHHADWPEWAEEYGMLDGPDSTAAAIHQAREAWLAIARQRVALLAILGREDLDALMYDCERL